jgi:hypothetical protein
MINQRIWRDSLELERPTLRFQHIHFFTRMQTVEEARIRNEQAAAQQAQVGGQGLTLAQVAVTIPPRDDLELEFDHGIEWSSDDDSENDWETESWSDSDIDRDNV